MKTTWTKTHKRVLAEFINIYRSEPCLWSTKSQEYRDRQMKEVAYERLSAKLREIDSTADREKVVKKINSLRTNYRKEKKKIEERPDKVNYKPRLWYYNMFNFLEGHEYTGPNPFDTTDSQDTFDDYDEYESDPLTEIYNELDEFETGLKQTNEREQQQENKPALEALQHTPPQSQAGSTRRPATLFQRKSTQKRRLSDESSEQSDYSPMPIKESSPKKIPRTEDRYDVFAQMVAIKLRSLTDKRQRILAEKAINDTLFMAEIGELTFDHVTGPLSLNTQSNSGIDYINSSTNHMDAVEENESNGVRVVYPSGTRF